jgi:(R,R)-butanediol dehydrogenase/meso-butanediol dehydrogenase/diacetyl reductase
MRAAVFKEAGKPLVIEHRPDPTPLEGEIVVKVGRCGICGSDLHLTESSHHPFSMAYPPDSLLGHEYAGEVVALGRGVDQLKVGDRVAAYSMLGCGNCQSCRAGLPKWCAQMRGVGSGFAEYSRANARDSVKLPSTLSLEDGALVEPLATGLHGVTMASLQAGARVLVMGVGAVGLATIYWARLLGAGRIVAMARSTQRRQLALSLGATHFVSAGENAVHEVADALGGPPDVVFECVGLPDMLMQATLHVRDRGTIIVLGFCTRPDTVVPSFATWKEVTMKFSFGYSGQEYVQTVDTLDAGHLEPRSMVTDRVTLDELPAAFEALRTKTTQCKVMVVPW